MTSQPTGVPAQTLAAEQIRAAITNHHQITKEYLIRYGEFPCDVCGKVLTTAQGRGAHRTKAHGNAS